MTHAKKWLRGTISLCALGLVIAPAQAIQTMESRQLGSPAPYSEAPVTALSAGYDAVFAAREKTVLSLPTTVVEGTSFLAQAPEETTGSLERGRLDRVARRIFTAYQEGRYADVLALIGENPSVREGRPAIDLINAWSDHQLGNASAAFDRFDRLYQTTSDAQVAEGLFYAAVANGSHQRFLEIATDAEGPVADYLGDEIEVQTDVGPQPAGRVFYRTWLDQALTEKRVVEAEGAADALVAQGAALTPQDRVALGWLTLGTGRVQSARLYFDAARLEPELTPDLKTDADYGYALALSRTAGRTATLNHLTSTGSEDPRLVALERDLRLQAANEAYANDDFASATRNLDRASRLGPLSRDARLLRAWSAQESGNAQQAADQFLALYQSTPDEASADGLIASYTSLDRRDDLRAIAELQEGPLGEKLEALGPAEVVEAPEEGAPLTEQVAQQPQDLLAEETPEPASVTRFPQFKIGTLTPAELGATRGRELAALAEDEETYGALKQLTGLHGDATVRYRSRDGDKGTSRLTQTTFEGRVSTSRGRQRVEARARLHSLDADGTPAQDVRLGTSLAPITRIFDFTTDDTVYDFEIAWQRQDILSLGASLGVSPLGGEVDASLVGELSATYALQRGDVGATLYRKAVDDSILSFAGAADPATGDGFGGVVEEAVRLNGFAQLTSKWRTTGSLTLGRRVGEDVEDNEFVDIRANLTRDIPRDGFEYIAVGPDFRYLSFDQNLSQFTLGHGGYFSPQELTQVGIGAYFMTDQGKRWLARGGVNLGYQQVEEDRAPVFPLQPNGQFYEDNSNAGLGLYAGLQGAWLLSDNLIFEAGGYFLDVQEFQEFAALAHFRYAFNGRQGVYAQDLTALLGE